MCIRIFIAFWFGIMLSDIGKCLIFGTSCSPDRIPCALSSVYSCDFYPWVSVGSSAGESVCTILHLGRMENDVNLSFLANPFCFSLMCCYLSAFESLRMDFGVRTSGRMFFAVVQIQLKTSLYSLSTALQRAQANFEYF